MKADRNCCCVGRLRLRAAALDALAMLTFTRHAHVDGGLQSRRTFAVAH